MINNIRLQIIRSVEGIESIRPIWEKIQAREVYPKINADIDQYLSVTQTGSKEIQPYIMLVKRNDVTITMLITSIHKSPFKCNFGRKTIFKPSLRTLSVVHGGLLGHSSEDICRLLIGELTKLLRSQEIDVIHFDHLETNSLMYRLARKIPSIHSRNHIPKVEAHWWMSVPENIDEFLQNCSKKSRQNLTRYVRNLEQEFPGQVKMLTYSHEDEVKSALKIVSQISSQTYQRAYGAGIVDNDITQQLFIKFAEKGWLRIHILFIGQEPCAFGYRMNYRGTYFAEAVGYLPQWKDFRVGHVLFYKVLEEICNDPTIHKFDFGFDDSEFKQHYGNHARKEASIYIFALRPVPLLTNVIFSTLMVTSCFIKHITKKLGFFNVVQRYRKRSVMQKNSDITNPVQDCHDMIEYYKYNHANGNLLIRRATENDIETLIKISRVGFPRRLVWCTRGQAKKWWKHSLVSKFSETWVCQYNGQVAGYVRLANNLKQYQKESSELFPDVKSLLQAFILRPWLLPLKITERIILKTSPRIIRTDLKELPASENPMWGYSMAVLPEVRNRGIGTSLIEFRDQRALELGHDSVKICIGTKRKAAIRLNEKSGFIRVAKKGIYYEYFKSLTSVNDKKSPFSKTVST